MYALTVVWLRETLWIIRYRLDYLLYWQGQGGNRRLILVSVDWEIIATGQSSIVDYQALQYCDNSLHLWLQIADFAFACQDITLGLQQTTNGFGMALPKLEFHQVVSVLSK